jgi:bifunctional non-homologous end joining protein LigD
MPTSASTATVSRRHAVTAPGTRAGAKPAAAAVLGVRISHPERVIDPDSGVTKLDLARYAESVAPLMLPHLDGRPVALVRAPDGLAGERFFQKHLARLVIPRIKQLDPALDPGHPPLLEIDSAAALVGAVQMGTLEFHPWNATHKAIEKPDRVIFDLDPDPDLPWALVLEAAELLKNLLDELQLQSFVKTSGGRGLHVLVPLARRHGWDAAKAFAQAVAQQLADGLPERFSARMGAQNRVGKVFVDYLRNTRGATAACAFSPRARPGLPVSVPIAWDELVTLRSGAQWTVRTLAQRLAELDGHDPWQGWSTCRQTLSAAVRHLQRARHAVVG